MLVYHGSNTAVETPEIRKPNRNLDFGIGFYTTMNEEYLTFKEARNG